DAARKAKQEMLLEQLRTAKDSFRPPANDDTSASIPLRSGAAENHGLTDWTPWILGVCLTGGVLVFLLRLRATQAVQVAPPLTHRQRRCPSGLLFRTLSNHN
ncbi:MAG: hypothetical protein N0E58_22995, partial [Candidatus Thiodiazotropha endolucinida]|nr:hypothetical protein [Candidatus Thiodiazotropha endolucinida]